VSDARGHGQKALGDPGEDAFGGAAAVAFEVELALEGVLAAYLMQVHGRCVVSPDTGVISGN